MAETNKLPKSRSGGALKLLDDLDHLESLLGTDAFKSTTSRTTQKQDPTVTYKRVQLGPVESNKPGITFNDAITTECLNPFSGNYVHSDGMSYKLASAFENELINADSVAFISPENGEILNLYDAILNGYIQKTGHYIEPSTGKRLKLRECMDRYIIVSRDIIIKTSSSSPRNTRQTQVEHENTTLDLHNQSVVEVMSPDTGQWLPVKQAVLSGIFDTNTNSYFNHQTGERLDLQQAFTRRLVKLGQNLDESVESNDTDILLESPSIIQSRNINYMSQVSDMSDLDISRDSADFLGDMKSSDLSGETSSISLSRVISGEINESLDSNEQTTPKQEVDSDDFLTVLESLDWSRLRVIDPRTTLMISYIEACDEGVIENGYYHNISTNQKIPIEQAFTYGLIEMERNSSSVPHTSSPVPTIHPLNTSMNTISPSKSVTTPPGATNAHMSPDATYAQMSPGMTYSNMSPGVTTVHTLPEMANVQLPHGAIAAQTSHEFTAETESGTFTTQTTVSSVSYYSEHNDSNTDRILQQAQFTSEEENNVEQPGYVRVPPLELPVSQSSSEAEHTNMFFSISDTTSLSGQSDSTNQIAELPFDQSEYGPTSTLTNEQRVFSGSSEGSGSDIPNTVREIPDQSASSKTPAIQLELSKRFAKQSDTVDKLNEETVETVRLQATHAPVTHLTTNETNIQTMASIDSSKPQPQITNTRSPKNQDITSPSPSANGKLEVAKMKTSFKGDNFNSIHEQHVTAEVHVSSDETMTSSEPKLSDLTRSLKSDTRQKQTTDVQKQEELISRVEAVIESATIKESSPSPPRRSPDKSPLQTTPSPTLSKSPSPQSTSGLKSQTHPISRSVPDRRVPADRHALPDRRISTPDSPFRSSRSPPKSLGSFINELEGKLNEKREVKERQSRTEAHSKKLSERKSELAERRLDDLVSNNRRTAYDSTSQEITTPDDVFRSPPQSPINQKSGVSPPATKATNQSITITQRPSSSVNRLVKPSDRSTNSPQLVSKATISHGPAASSPHAKTNSPSSAKSSTNSPHVKIHSPSSTPTCTNSSQSIKGGPAKILQLHEAIGALSYENAVRLGLLNIRTGQFRDPVSLSVIWVNEACRAGFVDPSKTALTDLRANRTYTLRECNTLKLIDTNSGLVNESRIKDMSICNLFIPSYDTSGHINIHLIDAVKIGLLCPYKVKFLHPNSEETYTLGEAVARNYISGFSAIVKHKKLRYTLSEALKNGMLDQKTGEIIDPDTNKSVCSFYEALISNYIESAYRPGSMTIMNTQTGQQVEINQAIRQSLLGHDNCLVFDSEQNRQVTFDEGIASSIIDRLSGCYTDRVTNTTISCQKAVQLGLIEIIASPVCSNLYLGTCIERLYTPAFNKSERKEEQNASFPSHPAPSPVVSPARQNITEKVITLESKKTRSSPHEDNISATVYFTKGDLAPAVRDDDSQVDNIKLNKTSVNGSNRDEINWDKIDIKPYQPRTIVIETKERTPPPDKQIIIIEREKDKQLQGFDISAALEFGYYDPHTDTFRHPHDEDRIVGLREAISCGYLIGSSLRDMELSIERYRRKHAPVIMEYQLQQDSAPSTARSPRSSGRLISDCINDGSLNIETGKYKDVTSLIYHSLADAVFNQLIDGQSGWYTNPSNKVLYSIEEAISERVIDNHGHWISSLTGQKQTISDGITKGHIVFSRPDHVIKIIKKVAVHHVIHPVSMEQIDYHTAVLQGVLNPNENIYKSPVTGDCLPIDEALNKGLINGMVISSKTRRIPTEPAAALPIEALFTERKSYTITHAKDTITGRNLTISEARSRNVLDADLTTFKDLRNNKLYSIQEAIEKMYLVATLDSPNCLTPRSSDNSGSPRSAAGTKFITTKTHEIQSVLDPSTNREMSVSEAVKEGLLDQETGDYVNLDEDISFSMDTAIKKGLIKTRLSTLPVNETMSFSISHITNPKTGETLSVSDGIRHGFIDRSRRNFCDIHTGQLYSLSDAIHNGWLHLKTNIGGRQLHQTIGQLPNRNNNTLQHNNNSGSTMPSAAMSFTIHSIRDVGQQLDIPVSAAVSRGILNLKTQTFKNTVTGEIMSVERAVKSDLIKLKPVVQQSTPAYNWSSAKPPYSHLVQPIYHSPPTQLQHSISYPPTGTSNTHYTGPHYPTSPQQNGNMYSTPNHLYNRHMSAGSTIPVSYTQAMNGGNQYNGSPIYSTINEQPLSIPQTSPHIINQNPAAEPVHSTVRKPRSRTRSGPTNSEQHKLEVIDIYMALNRGYLNHSTGEVKLPQYGSSMLIDDAVLQGIISTRVPLNTILTRVPNPSAFSISEAFAHGFVNPITLAVRHPVTGQFMSLENALTTGLLQPRASNSSAAVNLQAVNNTYSVPSKPARRVRSESSGRVERSRTNPHSQTIPTQPIYAKINKPKQTHHRKNLLDQNANVVRHNGLEIGTGSTLTSERGRSGSHLVNGNLYVARHGYHINTQGLVVNLQTGEATSLLQAEKAGIVRRQSESNRGESYVPASNLMFNRDPQPFPRTNTQPRVIHVRKTRSHSLDRHAVHSQYDALSGYGENLYSEINQ